MSFVNALLYSITPILLAMVKPVEVFYSIYNFDFGVLVKYKFLSR